MPLEKKKGFERERDIKLAREKLDQDLQGLFDRGICFQNSIKITFKKIKLRTNLLHFSQAS